MRNDRRFLRVKNYNPYLDCAVSICKIIGYLIVIAVTIASIPILLICAIMSGLVKGPVRTHRRFSPPQRRTWG
jgi:hypothetical protein